jgi:glutamate---cysteine ligase / carboxylate-amine ligase
MPTGTETAGRWESNFGVEADFAIGVEEELLLVDEQGALLERGEQVAEETKPEEGELVAELFEAMVESNSEVSRSAGQATEALRAIRRDMLEGGSRLMAVGVHPDVRSGEARTGTSPRYEAIAGDLRGLLRTPICGQHVHVGMPDAESAIRAYNGIRTHIPLLNALAANSPFWFGEDSGLASARTAIFRSYPRNAMAPAFEDVGEFTRVTRQVCAAAGVEDYTHIWWDARIHPGLGTVEVRAADTQFDLDRAAGIAALTHCLALVEAGRRQDDIPAREALAESSFQATRHGLQATLLDRDAEPVPARDLANRTLELASAVADELECGAELATVQAILDDGNGAEQQRAVFEEGGMKALLDFLVERTAAI